MNWRLPIWQSDSTAFLHSILSNLIDRISFLLSMYQFRMFIFALDFGRLRQVRSSDSRESRRCKGRFGVCRLREVFVHHVREMEDALKNHSWLVATRKARKPANAGTKIKIFSFVVDWCAVLEKQVFGLLRQRGIWVLKLPFLCW
jgi:hypothetical protein